MTAPTFPLEPLAAAAGVTLGQIGGQTRAGDHDARHGYAELGELLDVSRTTLRRRRATGITIDEADEWALRLGLLPHEVWPDWYRICSLPPAGAVNALKSHCPQGHPYSHVDAEGKRRCRYCDRTKVNRMRDGIRANRQVAQVVTPAPHVQQELFAC